jgi:hypothetical protein
MTEKPFNLKSLKNDREPRPIDIIRSKCPGIRPNELDLDDEDVTFLAKVLASGKGIRQAVHGRGDAWTEVGPDYNPYKGSPMTTSRPQFGDRWRGDFPGSGDQHINDDSDKKKNQKGEARNEEFDPELRKQKTNDALDEVSKKVRGPGFVVKLELDDKQPATEDLASQVFGDAGQFDGTYVFVHVNDFEAALEEQRKQRSRGRKVMIETK